MTDEVAYYRADARGLNRGDATTRLDVARGIAARHTDFAVYSVTLNEPIEADPDAARDNLGEVFVGSPWGAVVDVVDENES
jgi:hypothetical protein